MNREEAAGVLSAMRDTLRKVYLIAIDEERTSALDVAIDYLLASDTNVARSPWAKTADRLPDKCEYYTMYLTTKKRNGGVWQVRGSFIKEHPELCPWWMPIPSLPGVTE